MYKKKNNKPMYFTIAVIMIVIMALVAASYFTNMKREREAAAKTQVADEKNMHDVLMYKTSEAVIEFEKGWLKYDGDMETILEIETDELVTLLVTPKQGKLLESVDIVDYQFHDVNNFLRETSTDAIRVNFVMPDTDIIINYNLVDEETQPVAESQEKETKAELEELPYGLTLHGLTPEIIASYQGKFDDRDFLQQLGDALHMDSARSEYQNVTDVTFSTEHYENETEEDKVFHYIYFNQTPEWKVLSTYYMKEDSYIFTEPVAETEKSTELAGEDSAGNTTVVYENAGGGRTSGGGNKTTVTTYTALDILKVSSTFLAFTGDEDVFYEKTFHYAVKKGLQGMIVGTMSDYKINPEKQTATFRILLNTGKTIEGTYDKNKDDYHFSGL